MKISTAILPGQVGPKLPDKQYKPLCGQTLYQVQGKLYRRGAFYIDSNPKSKPKGEKHNEAKRTEANPHERGRGDRD
jgi:hypothetical protein